MRPLIVNVWRGETHNVAAMSITDEKFLEDLKRWIKKQKEYDISFRETTLGPEHQ